MTQEERRGTGATEPSVLTEALPLSAVCLQLLIPVVAPAHTALRWAVPQLCDELKSLWAAALG